MTSPTPAGRDPQAQAAMGQTVRGAGAKLRWISYFLLVGGILLMLVALDLGGVAETLASDSATNHVDDGSSPMTSGQIKTFALWFAVGMLGLGIVLFFVGGALVKAGDQATDSLHGSSGSTTGG